MSPSQPSLPEYPFADQDSMLSRKFGKETINYFSGSPLNRVSFLRTSTPFLTAALAAPGTRFLLINDLAPLAKDGSNLAYVGRDEVTPLIGEEPFAKTEKELVESFDSRIERPVVVFLGLDERETAKPASGDFWSWEGHGKEKEPQESKEAKHPSEAYRGTPYFAVDITPRGSVTEAAKALIEAQNGKGLQWLGGRNAMTLNAYEAAVFAQARALFDWHARNPYCGSCGSRTTHVQGGTKRVCPPVDKANPDNGKPDCPTRKGVSNLSFPRTDPTVIAAILSHDSQKILLGRQRRWPTDWYSTLAGFLEPGESVEEAVRREVWEESGVKVGRVVIHSTQPWPYPANLMIGAIGQAVEGGENVHLGHDEELEDAKWFPVEEVRAAIKKGGSGLDASDEGTKPGELRIPPATAIAHQLMSAVVNGLVAGEVKI
jgi:NAD+ diphosphatase